MINSIIKLPVYRCSSSKKFKVPILSNFHTIQFLLISLGVNLDLSGNESKSRSIPVNRQINSWKSYT